GAGLGHCNSVSHPPDTLKIVRRAARKFGVEWGNPCRDPRGKMKPRRHHSYNRIDSALHSQVKLGEVRCTAEISLPIAIADDDCRRAVNALLLGRERAAAKRLDTQRFKKAAGNLRHVDAHRLAASGDGRYPIRIFRQACERVVLCPKVFEVRVSEGHSMTIGSLFPYAH